MTTLSVNLNKLALLRNARGQDYPSVTHFAKKFIDLGVRSLTIHPRPDQRHITKDDVHDLSGLLHQYPGVELNIEGYPSDQFLYMLQNLRPAQCTLVPDKPGQLTSDHGWDLVKDELLLSDILADLRPFGVRVSVFVEPDEAQMEHAAELDFDCVECYTESYALAYESGSYMQALNVYGRAIAAARIHGLRVHAGHGLNLDNLPALLSIGGIHEVSIGHALIVECIEHGMKRTIERYLKLCADAP